MRSSNNLFKNDKMEIVKEYLDEKNLFKYILYCVWRRLVEKSRDCENCDDVLSIKIYLEKLCEENDIELKINND